MSAYSEASKAVFEVFEDTTPLVEGLSIDEAFLDVRGLRAARRLAGRDRRRGCAREVRDAGRAADHGRRRAHQVPRQGGERAWRSPTGCCSCRPSDELGFLHPLPVERLWGVGRGHGRASSTGAGISTRRPGRRARRGGARRMLGPRLGPAPARARAQPRPAPGADGSAPPLDRVAAGARAAADVARRRSTRQLIAHRRPRSPGGSAPARRVGRTVVLRLRFDDFTRATRSLTLPRPTDQSRDDPRRGPHPARRRDRR